MNSPTRTALIAAYYLFLLLNLSACQLGSVWSDSGTTQLETSNDFAPSSADGLERFAKDWATRMSASSLEWRVRSTDPLVLIDPIAPNLFFSLSQAGKSRLVNISDNRSAKLCRFDKGFNAAAVESGSGLLALAYPSEVFIYHLADCQEKYRITRIGTRVSAMQFHPNSESVILAGIDSRVYRWHFLNDRPDLGVKQQALALERYFGHPTPVTTLALHYDGRIFFSGDNNGVVFAWRYFDSDRYQGEFDKNKQFGLRGHSERASRSAFRLQSQSGIKQLRISSDGRYLIVASQAGFIELRKVRGFKLLTSFAAHSGLIYDLLFLDQEPLTFASAGRDNLLKVWTAKPEVNITGLYKPSVVLEQRIENIRQLSEINKESFLTVTSSGAMQTINLVNEAND